jgi:alpha-amylase/alpha-mannosidase (GH57 family)
VPRLRLAEDARRQLDEALAFMRARGFEPQGCWPPEGSVSAAAVAVYAKAGVRFLVTDEGILERSLGKQLRFGESAAPELYRPWRLAGPCPSLFFRDRWLSDAIGFVYGHWQDEGQAARTLVDNLRGLARTLPKEASIVIALDGENPWAHYAECGGRFLRELMARLNDAGDELRPATLSEVRRRATGNPPTCTGFVDQRISRPDRPPGEDRGLRCWRRSPRGERRGRAVPHSLLPG